MILDKKNFSTWYSEVLASCDIVDLRYPVKGMPVYRPWGFSILRKMFSHLEKMLDTAGHQQMLFPLFVPDDQFGKEAEHIKGFEDQVLWVTHAGLSRLERKLAVRPTSETVMYPMFSLWIQSHGDLPLKVHQTVCIYRHETKATRPLIRGREVYWNEAHTVHATKEEAEAQVREGVSIYRSFFDMLGVPYVIVKRPSFDKFAGSEYSVAFDCPMPDGKVLQIGTVHNLGQNFAKVYEVTYTDEKGEKCYAYQTCYGISMRALAALIAIHGDEKGLVLPPRVSPVDVVIVPILYGEGKEIIEKSREVAETLRREGYVVIVDESNKRPGEKYYYWESRGIPLRIEIGPKDIEQKSVTVVTRLGAREKIPTASIVPEIARLRERLEKELYARAQHYMNESIGDAQSVEHISSIAEQKTFVRLFLCAETTCASMIEKYGISIRGTPFEHEKEGPCVVCGKKGKETYCAQAY